MKKYLIDLAKVFSLHVISLSLIIWWASVYAAVSFPSSHPDWQDDGWRFMKLLQLILVNSNSATTDWTVKKAALADKLNQASCPSWQTINWFDASWVRTCTNN